LEGVEEVAKEGLFCLGSLGGVNEQGRVLCRDQGVGGGKKVNAWLLLLLLIMATVELVKSAGVACAGG